MFWPFRPVADDYTVNPLQPFQAAASSCGFQQTKYFCYSPHMNEDHPTRKTIALLAALTIDGSLSGTEIWELADFLNNNKDCRENWPGSVIFPLLANAYADGELSKDEMRTLAQMIANVEREWFWRSETSNLPAEQLSPGATPDFLDMTVPVRTRSASSLLKKAYLFAKSDLHGARDSG